jgi:hypothetical protein
MTVEELDCIERALTALLTHDGCSPGAKQAASQFNARLERERARLLGGARPTQGDAGAFTSELEIELRGAAIMYAVERERVARLWRLPLRLPA